MPSYLVVFKREGDFGEHSIGNGERLDYVEAFTPDEALEIAIHNWFGCDPTEEYDDDPFGEERHENTMEYVHIYEATLVDSGDLFEEYHRKIIDRLEKSKQTELEELERLELERLKKKYEG